MLYGINQLGGSLKCLMLLILTFLAWCAPAYSLDITLQWDANTETNLAGYKVYYKTETSGPPYNGTGAVEGPSPLHVSRNTTQYILHGLSEDVVYFFAVTAYNTNQLESGFSNEVDALGVSLDSGPNLVSLYRQPENTSVSAVLRSIQGQYTNVWAYVNGGWRVYDPAKPGFNDLTTMEAGKGYWIEMNEPGILLLYGPTSPASIRLTAGSNLVGYFSPRTQSISYAIRSIQGNVISVWGYVNGGWRVYDPANPGFSDLNILEPGIGYWIETSMACTWSLP
ncbi:MAG: fibronectin type III domain-containing protein [Deltaproteobacteria bacterium]|nr:fibronectin type III domain-containing protein [Deltaproteobacteria bacterium]